ncbi:MAG: hypothetical protein QME46_11920 [Thermoanaerobacteraceae bacterium]|nr:hypothetical protein [Thermoanaerobacteraceae bacterium]
MDTNTLFNRNVIGLRELRRNISELFHFSVYNFKDFLIGNTKKGGKTVTLISTDLLNDLLENYKFNTEIKFDKGTNQYEAIVDVVDASGCGDTKEEAINMLLDNIIDLCDDYFDNIELYLRVPNTKKQYPYYMRIKNCRNRAELIKILGLDNVQGD